MSTTNTLAKQLYDYMTFRAKAEGKGHQLSEGFYRNALRKGANKIFGIVIHEGRLCGDIQNPEAFEKWSGHKSEWLL